MVLGEVVAEATLHARRPLIRGVELNVGGRHAGDLPAGDVQVDLAADAAIGADGAHDPLGGADLLVGEALQGQGLEDRASGTDAHALAAPRAAGLVGVAVGAHDDLRVLAAPRDIEHADHLDVDARPHAARAEDAGRHVVADHRIAGALVAAADRQIAAGERRRLDAVADYVLLELVARLRAAAVAQMVARIALEQQAQHPAAVLDGGVGFGGHHHPVGHLGRACRQQLRLAFHGYEADAAIADDGELGIPAQRGDVDAGRARGVEDRRVGSGGERAAVDGEAGHRPVDIEDSLACSNRRITLRSPRLRNAFDAQLGGGPAVRGGAQRHHRHGARHPAAAARFHGPFIACHAVLAGADFPRGARRRHVGPVRRRVALAALRQPLRRVDRRGEPVGSRRRAPLSHPRTRGGAGGNRG